MKTGNNIFAVLVLSLLLASCKLASFTDRPGVIVPTYPKELYGTWLNIEKHKGVSDTHRLVIDTAGARMDDELIGSVMELSDSNVSLSHLGDYYYLNFRETDSSGHVVYFIYPFEFTEKKLFVYKLQLTKKSLKKMERSGLKPTGRKNGEYLMENNAFKTYCERYLKKKDAIIFKRTAS